MDQSLRQLKIEHLKRKALEDLQSCKYRSAYQRYTEALALCSDKENMKRIYSNRSLAYAKASRYAEALADARLALSLAPQWDKAFYREGAALQNLKRHYEAAQSFRSAWLINKDNGEAAKALHHSVKALGREEIASGLLDELQRMQHEGKMMKPSKELATSEELQEAAFSIVKASQRDVPRAKPYYMQLLRWLKEGLHAGEAYTQRSAIFAAANCFLQAREDASAAKQWYQTADCDGLVEPFVLQAMAFLRSGQALMAKSGHADRQECQAVKEFARGLQIDPANPDLQDDLKAALHTLSLEQLHQVQMELKAEGCSILSESEAMAECTIRLHFYEAGDQQCSAAARKEVCTALASQLKVTPATVLVEGIRTDKDGLFIELATALPNEASAKALDTEEDLELGGQIRSQYGKCKIAVTVRQQQVVLQSSEEAGPSQALVPVPRPKLEIALPYKDYRLVDADGKKVERLDKHPFCMSRVFYTKDDRPEQVWAQDSADCYRWRQSSSEIKLIALKVPSNLKANQLTITFEPFSLKVAHRDTGDVYLEGRLERAVVPKECLWMYDTGHGEDGCLILLQKLNLELFRRHWQHSETWWPKLFKDGPEIAWDDYEKDYSDLPSLVMAEHAALEAAKEATRQLEAAEKSERDKREEEESRRKSRRFAKLKLMKPGSFIAWSHLQHALIACSQ